jgi:uncharacterized protein (TIGR02268 family)
LFQSSPLALVLVLLGETVARAQPAPAREQRQRTVTVTGNPADPPLEVRVAPDSPTGFLFDADLRKKAVQVEASRIRVLDSGERSLIVQAVKALGDGERVELEVPFADGKAPERARFVLVSDPSEVDAMITVTRRVQPDTAPPVEARATVRRPEDFLLLGYMGKDGVLTAGFDAHKDSEHGLYCSQGVVYRGKGWLMFEVRISNQQGPQPWVPSEATLTGKAGAKLSGRVVTEQEAEHAPKAPVRVLVVTEEPPASAGLVFSLELRRADGQTLALPDVKIPAWVKEHKP